METGATAQGDVCHPRPAKSGRGRTGHLPPRGAAHERRCNMVALANTKPVDIVAKLVLQGDLKGLTPEERCQYYARVCESVGLNPLTRPFEYITLNGKLTLYARKDATDQLRNLNGVSIYKLEREQIGDLY